jgi:hypothetical protein
MPKSSTIVKSAAKPDGSKGREPIKDSGARRTSVSPPVSRLSLRRRGRSSINAGSEGSSGRIHTTSSSSTSSAPARTAALPRHIRAAEKRERQITLRLTGATLEAFSRMEEELGVLASDLFRDGLWLASMAAARYTRNDHRFQVTLQHPEHDAPIDVLARGTLCSVERFSRAEVRPSGAARMMI